MAEFFLGIVLAIQSFFGFAPEPESAILGASGFTTFQGGTGTTSPSGILYGDETIRLKTVTIGSNLTFSGGTLSASASAGVWPFVTTDTNYGVAVQSTTTPEWFKNGLMSSTTARFVYASTTALNAVTICLDGDTCRTTWPSSSGGTGNVATSTAETQFQIPYWDSTAATPALLGASNTFTFTPSSGVLVAGTLKSTAHPTDGNVSLISTNGTFTLKADHTHVGSGTGSRITVAGGDATSLSDRNGGDVFLTGGTPDGLGVEGRVYLTQSNNANRVGFNLSSLTTARTQAIQDKDGTIALTSDIFAYPFPSDATTTNITFSSGLTGDLTGNADTATALAGNGANCSLGNAPLGVDASGAVENCFDVWTEAENTSAAYLSTVDISANTNLAATFPIKLTGDTLSFNGLSTSSPIAAGAAVLYATGVNTVASAATTTASCTGTVSCSDFTVIGASPITIDGSSGTAASSTLLSDVNTFSGATTTFSNAMQIGGTAANHLFTLVAPSKTYSTSVSVGGAGNMNFSNANAGLYLYTDNTASDGALFSMDCNTATMSTQCFRIQSIASNQSVFNIQGGPTGLGVVKISSQQDQGTNGSLISLDASTNSNTGMLIFGKGNNTGKLLALRNGDNAEVLTLLPSGRLGLNSTAPTAAFQIGNSFMVATTTASTTIMGTLNFAGTGGTAWSDFCTAITGGAGLCDGTDATGGGSGTVSTSTNETAGNLAYWTSTNGTPATLGKIATTTLAFSGPFTGASALGTLVGGSNSTVTWTGLATTSQPSSSNLLVSNGGAGVYGVATTSITCTGLLSCTGFSALGAASSLNLAAANANTVLVNGTGAQAVPTFQATSTFGTNLYGNGTAGQVLMWSGAAPVWSSTSTCTAITGSADLCDGNDATGAGGAFSWTPTTYNAVAVNATSTGLWLKATTPFSLIASSTYTTQASTTVLDVLGPAGSATSTWLGDVAFGSITGQNNQIRVQVPRNYNNSSSVGGAVNITNTSNNGPALVVYSNQASSNGNLVNMRCDNATYAHDCVRIDADGTGDGLAIVATAAASNALSISSTGVDHTFNAAYTGSTANKGAANFTSTNTTGSALQVSGAGAAGLGLFKATINATGFDASTAIYSGDISVASYTGQGVFIDSSGGGWVGKILNLRANGTEYLTLDTSGKMGLASSSPWGQLSVNPTSANGSAPSFVVGSSTATRFIITNDGKVGVATTSPVKTFSVQGETWASATSTVGGLNVLNPTVGTSTGYFYSKTAGFGGQIILEDQGGGACTAIVTAAGTVTGKVVTCPTEF